MITSLALKPSEVGAIHAVLVAPTDELTPNFNLPTWPVDEVLPTPYSPWRVITLQAGQAQWDIKQLAAPAQGYLSQLRIPLSDVQLLQAASWQALLGRRVSLMVQCLHGLGWYQLNPKRGLLCHTQAMGDKGQLDLVFRGADLYPWLLHDPHGTQTLGLPEPRLDPVQVAVQTSSGTLLSFTGQDCDRIGMMALPTGVLRTLPVSETEIMAWLPAGQAPGVYRLLLHAHGRVITTDVEITYV